MSLMTILGMAVGLGMDAFAVALGSGCQLGRVTVIPTLRMAGAFGFFQALMPLLGWGLGKALARFLENAAPWVAGGLLLGVAGHMLVGGLKKEGQEKHSLQDPTRGWRLWGLAVATSIDAFAVGTSLSLLRLSIWLPIAVIGVVAFLMSVLGMVLGGRLGQRLGKHAETAGGLILLVIALRLIF